MEVPRKPSFRGLLGLVTHNLRQNIYDLHQLEYSLLTSLNPDGSSADTGRKDGWVPSGICGSRTVG
jgi:hypothetical protein